MNPEDKSDGATDMPCIKKTTLYFASPRVHVLLEADHQAPQILVHAITWDSYLHPYTANNVFGFCQGQHT